MSSTTYFFSIRHLEKRYPCAFLDILALRMDNLSSHVFDYFDEIAKSEIKYKGLYYIQDREIPLPWPINHNVLPSFGPYALSQVA